jgi:hypothetical protein
MSFMQGDPLPDVTVTKSTDQETPDYYTDYLTDLSDAGETALGLTGAQFTNHRLRTTDQRLRRKVPRCRRRLIEDLMGLAETAGEGFGAIDATNISAFSTRIKRECLNEMEQALCS